jgi:hypothetical protein
MHKQIVFALKRLLPAYWPNHSKYHCRPVRPRVVYLVAMPRTGSTLAKRYLGEHPALVVAPNQPYRHAWRLANQLQPQRIVIDKRINNLDKIGSIYFEFGNWAWFAGIVRDPRDELVSLLETDRHPEVPRSPDFWNYWLAKYQRLLAFAKAHADAGVQLCLVRYEDLVHDPILVKGQFLKWLGIDAQADQLSVCYGNTIAQIAAGEDVTEDWKTHQQHAVHQESVGRWRSVVQPKHARLIRYYRQLPAVERFMHMLGYGEGVQILDHDLDGMKALGRQPGPAMDLNGDRHPTAA